MDNLSNIFARNCTVRRIDRTAASAFLERYHRLGATGGRFFYGIYTVRSTGAGELRLSPGSLVAVASFSTARRWSKPEGIVSSYEWIRYASMEGVRVVGGMSKVLKHFINEVSPDDIMTYADPQSSDGGQVYVKLGFVSEGMVEKNGWRCEKFRLKTQLRHLPNEPHLLQEPH